MALDAPNALSDRDPPPWTIAALWAALVIAGVAALYLWLQIVTMALVYGPRLGFWAWLGGLAAAMTVSSRLGRV